MLEDSHFGPDRLMSKLIEDIPQSALDIYDQCIVREVQLKSRSYAEMTEKEKTTYYFFPFNRNEREYHGDSL